MTNQKLTKIERRKVFDLIKQFIKHNLIPDRLEYDVKDLRMAYPELSKSQAEFLFKELKRRYR